MNNKTALAASVVLSLMLPGVCLADVITSAVGVSGPPPIDGFVWENTIDQSGLSDSYVSGVTDFDVYIGLSPTHTRNNNPENFAASRSLPPLNIDYDLGEVLSVTQLALWNYPFGNSAGIIDFNVFTAELPDFSDSEFVGAFTALDDGNGDVNNVQVFDLIDSDARYVRLEVVSVARGNGTGLSEIAFATIPGPATAAVFLIAAVFGRRRRR